jgi:hypothetical protein
MEYIYDTPEKALEDMASWSVQKTLAISGKVKIRSTVLPLEVLKADEEEVTLAWPEVSKQ